MIITSLLDTDFYKFTMGQFVWKYYSKVKVKYEFKNRTPAVKLGDIINLGELNSELNAVTNLKFTVDELQYLEKLGIFSRDYLNFLNKLTLPPVYVSNDNGTLKIETEGLWSEAIYWETIILSIVNELYYKHWSHNKAGSIGKFNERLHNKIEQINKTPFQFIEFGTRRRYSREAQQEVIEQLCDNLENDSLTGTSNVYLAKEYNLKPIGTMAHELPMVLAGISDENITVLKNSHDKMLTLWYYLYGENLSIALTDTFGTEFFFKDFTKEKALEWKGLRQDSGDPIEFGKSSIKYYKKNKINPKEKLVIFSDGLNIDKIQKLEKEFKGKIKTAYGWGTNLTNDLGYEPLSIVVKATKANGRSLVKLSDNVAKAMGNPKNIEKYKKAFGYTSTYEEPLYY